MQHIIDRYIIWKAQAHLHVSISFSIYDNFCLPRSSPSTDLSDSSPELKLSVSVPDTPLLHTDVSEPCRLTLDALALRPDVRWYAGEIDGPLANLLARACRPAASSKMKLKITIGQDGCDESVS